MAVTDADGLLGSDSRRLVTLQLAKMIGELAQSVGTPVCSAALSSVSSFVDVALEKYGVHREGGGDQGEDKAATVSRAQQRPKGQGEGFVWMYTYLLFVFFLAWLHAVFRKKR